MTELKPSDLRPHGPLLVHFLFWLVIAVFAFADGWGAFDEETGYLVGLAGDDCYDFRRSDYDPEIGLCSCEMGYGIWDANGICRSPGNVGK